MPTLEPFEAKSSVATSETKAANLTMPQLKKMRQESKLVKQRVRRMSLNAVCGDIELTNWAAYNPGFLCDDLGTEDTCNLQTALESVSDTEAPSKRTPELTWKIDSSTIVDRRSRANQSEVSLTSSRPESPQIVFQMSNNSQEVYQLREYAAPKSKVWFNNDVHLHLQTELLFATYLYPSIEKCFIFLSVSKTRKVKVKKITETRSDWSLFLFSPSNR